MKYFLWVLQKQKNKKIEKKTTKKLQHLLEFVYLKEKKKKEKAKSTHLSAKKTVE